MLFNSSKIGLHNKFGNHFVKNIIMKIKITLLLIASSLLSCVEITDANKPKTPAISAVGTWQLQTGTLIEKGDTTVTDYTKNISFIKIINETHFAFIQHDLKNGQDSSAVFSAGGGRYSLTDSLYTEYLEYCSARNWEGNDFKFTITVDADTLVQNGIEVIESEGVNRINIERYIRVKPAH